MHLSGELSQRQQQPPPNGPPITTTTGPSPTTSTVPSSTSSVSPTPTSSPDGSGGQPTTIIAVVIVVASLIALLGFVFFLRHVRIRHKDPKYVPTRYLKNKWRKWDPDPHHYRLPATNEHLEPISSSSTRRTTEPLSSVDTSNRNPSSSANRNSTTAAGVDRNTSVRSVMTLPPYNQNALQNEQVLGREGDRGGIDVVIEFPETVDEEEFRRDEEMEALYQVRLARRRENEEREERRRLRREARERGDYVALREIQARARAASSTSASQTVEELRAEHTRIKNERQRAVSSVSYADLGVARHDGTRIRANSQDSERTGLLGDAASMAASSHRHRRDRSASSVLSINTDNSDNDMPSPRHNRSRAGSRVSQGRPSGEGAGSSPEMVEHEDIPSHSPPEYEHIPLDTPNDNPQPHEPPPEYQSPIVGRDERSPRLEDHLPESTQRESSTESGRRQSRSTRVGDLIGERRTSGSPHTNASSSPGRGVGGVPQLPSLRLAALPSIQVDPGSPVVRPTRVDEE